MASRKQSGTSSARRDFLKSVAGIGGVATAAALAGTTASADTGAGRGSVKDGTEASRGYHETAHIREYYRIASLV